VVEGDAQGTAPDVLNTTRSRELGELRRSHPEQHFALGVLYAASGFLLDASLELLHVPASDPHYVLAREFLEDFRSPLWSESLARRLKDVRSTSTSVKT